LKREFDICCIGHMCADVFVGTVDDLPRRGTQQLIDTASLSVGGCALNTSIGLAKLGMHTALLGKVGNDQFGDIIKRSLKYNGVDIGGLKTENGSMSSLSVVLNSSDGERTILHYVGTNASLCFGDIDLDYLKHSAALFIGGALLMPRFDGKDAAAALAYAKRNGLMTAMDTAWDSTGRWLLAIEPCLPYLDWFMPSIDEAEKMLGTRDQHELARMFIQKGVKNVVIKKGRDGAYVCPGNGQAFESGVFKVNCVDTAGAGDAWCAGFIAGLSKGFALKDSARLGAANAALCVMQLGTTKGLLSFEETLAFMETYKAGETGKG
jgi:sugar/nucleoside kinase (ribokinase family)